MSRTTTTMIRASNRTAAKRIHRAVARGFMAGVPLPEVARRARVKIGRCWDEATALVRSVAGPKRLIVLATLEVAAVTLNDQELAARAVAERAEIVSAIMGVSVGKK